MFACAVLAALPLFDGGATKWTISVGENPAPEVAYAAEEFAAAVRRVSGAELPITKGVAASPSVRIVVEGEATDDERVGYAFDGGDLVIRGNLPRAALHGVYAFLQRELGVRWYGADSECEVYPKRDRYELRDGLAWSFAPPIRYRGFHCCGDWYRRKEFIVFAARNFANIHRHGTTVWDRKLGYWNMISSHNASLNGDKRLFAEHPEYYCELNGVRTRANICFSSDGAVDEVVRRLTEDVNRRKKHGLEILSIFPSDNQDYCRCAECRKTSVSTGWFRFYNKCVRKLRVAFPGLKFATIAYQGYRDVPEDPVEDTEFVEYATHGRCNCHFFGESGCGSAADLKLMEKWRATGTPMGQYAYEYDIFHANSSYLPLFRLIDDTVDTAVRLGHRVIIPEVGMSPRNGPDIKVNWLRNRLTIAWYAQKMWNPSLKLGDWLREMTANLFGPGGPAMYRYFMTLEKAWHDQKGHVGILGNGIGVVDRVFAEATVRELSAALDEAEQAIGGCTDGEKTRYVSCLTREKAMYRTWLDVLDKKKGVSATVMVPLVGRPEDAEDRFAWTAHKDRRGELVGDRLILRLRPQGPLTVEIGPSDSGELVTLARGADGGWTTSHLSEVGIRDAAWTCGIAEADGRIVVDLSGFRRIPRKGETWSVALNAGGKKAAAPLCFTGLGAVDQPLAWWMGLSRELPRIPSQRDLARQHGYKAAFFTNETDFVAAAKTAKAFYIRNPEKSFTPACQAALREAVAAGATCLVAGYNRYRMQNVIGDPAVRSRPDSPAPLALARRRSTFVLDGDWQTTPWDVGRKLKHGITPAYAQVGEGDGWTVLAAMLGKDGGDVPYLSVRPYGKGVLILAGAEVPANAFQLLANLSRFYGKP